MFVIHLLALLFSSPLAVVHLNEAGAGSTWLTVLSITCMEAHTKFSVTLASPKLDPNTT